MPKSLINLDIDLLRTFVVIASERNFTRAAERLMRQQSTVSLQIKRLEDALGQRLLDRTPRSVELTPEGEAVLAYAQKILDLNDEVVSLTHEPQMQGVVRLGTPEDFATQHLPDILARFVQAYPSVALEVTCDLTLNLAQGFRKGEFDIVLLKRERSAGNGGVRVWREPLVWVAGQHDYVHGSGPLPLVVSPEPCVYRKRAIESLDRARRRWRIAYTCGSLAGSIAAVRAGLGISVLPKEMVPNGLHAIDGDPLPDLKDTEIALLSGPSLRAPVAKLRDHIVRCLG
ncbi:MAG: LysR family transcriptional regulator [Hyphomicrobium sp.]|mgnify:FL=1|nr:LysR family transcriptional regulator [Hyphomicrobium sp.]